MDEETAVNESCDARVQMVEMLNKMYNLFDEITDEYKVYKVIHARLLLLLLLLFITARRCTVMVVLSSPHIGNDSNCRATSHFI